MYIPDDPVPDTPDRVSDECYIWFIVVTIQVDVIVVSYKPNNVEHIIV